MDSINEIFLARVHPLICFSHARSPIALVVALEIYEAIAFVFPCKPLERSVLVRPNAMFDIARYPDIKYTGAIATLYTE